VDHTVDGKAAGSREELDATPQLQAKTRQSNAHERKRQRKTKEASVSKSCAKPQNNEHESVTPPATVPAPVQVILPERPEVCPEKCAEPAKELETVVDEQPSHMDKTSVDEQDETPVETQASEQVQINERVAKLMAKKTERKARKALEKKALEEKAAEEHEQSPSVANVEAGSEVEAVTCDAQTTSASSMVQITSAPSDELEQENIIGSENEPHSSTIELQISQEVGQEDDQAQSNADEPYIIEEEVAEGKFVCDVSLETMETEYVNSEELGSTPEGICTPEDSWNPGHIDMGNPPMIWCGVNEAELDQNQATCDNQEFAPMVPQIEGWIPVVVPGASSSWCI
jgi:hypothetical protein